MNITPKVEKLLGILADLKARWDIDNIPNWKEFLGRTEVDPCKKCGHPRRINFVELRDLSPKEQGRKDFLASLGALVRALNDPPPGTKLKVSEAARATGFSQSDITKACDAGDVAAWGKNRDRVIDPESLIQWALKRPRSAKKSEAETSESDLQEDKAYRRTLEAQKVAGNGRRVSK